MTEWINEFGVVLSVDAKGHQHKGTGSGGGQFTSTSVSEQKSKQKPTAAKLAASFVYRWSWKGVNSLPPIAVENIFKQTRPKGPIVLYRFERKDHDPSKTQMNPNVPLQAWTSNKNTAVGIANAMNEDPEQGAEYIVKEKIFQPHEVYVDFGKLPDDVKSHITEMGGDSEMDEVLVYNFSLSKKLSLWADNNMRDCLTAAGLDVEAGLVAGEVLLSILPLPDEVEIEQEEVDDDGNDPIPVDLNAFFAFDIFNRQAQGILNRSIIAAKGVSASARKDLEVALKKARTGSGEAILNFIDKYRVQLAKILTQTQLASILSGAREVADKVPTLSEFPGAVPPPPTLEPQEAIKLVERLEKLDPDERAEEVYKLPGPEQVYVNQAIAVRAAPPAVIPPIVPQGGGGGAPEDVHLVTIDEAVRNLAERNVMDRQKYDALEYAARAKAFTVANVQAEETLTKIRDSLAENVKEGADYETWRKKVMEDVDQGTFMSDAHQETVFRTNVQTGFSDGQEAILNHPLVRSGFPYRVYDAIHDDRVRKEHLALDTAGIDGTNIYRADDPVWQLFRPPWGYNCRCSATPMTVRFAAEKGIKEAQTWLETGVEPTDKAWVKMPDFQPPPGFQRAVASVPMSIQLSLQPIVIFSHDVSNEKRDKSGKWTKGGSKTISINNSDYKIESQTNPDWGEGRTRFIAKDSKGKEVGHVSVLNYGNHLRVTSSFTDENVRGKGIGRRLYKQVIKLAQSAGITEVRSDTSVSNSAAKMWEKMGASKEKTDYGMQYILYINDLLLSINKPEEESESIFSHDVSNEKRDESGRWTTEGGVASHGTVIPINKKTLTVEAILKTASSHYPEASKLVDGRKVTKKVDNTSSIDAELTNYETLDGIREVNIEDFETIRNNRKEGTVHRRYSPQEKERVSKLADRIKQSGSISPLIVVDDGHPDGPYVLEGGHRLDALERLGAKSFPAVVVIDFGGIKSNVADSKLTSRLAPSEKVVLAILKQDEETDVALLYGQCEGWGAITGGALDTAHERNQGKKVKVLKAKTAKGKRVRRSLFKKLRVKRKWRPAVSLSIDSEGHQHKGKGKGGGQFTRESSNSKQEPTPKTLEDAHAKASSRISDWMKESARFPKRAVRYATKKASVMYAKLESKYGPKWAKTILVVGIVTLPTPFTTGAVLATCGVARLSQKVLGRGQAAMSLNDKEMDLDEVGRIGRKFIDTLIKMMEKVVGDKRLSINEGDPPDIVPVIDSSARGQFPQSSNNPENNQPKENSTNTTLPKKINVTCDWNTLKCVMVGRGDNDVLPAWYPSFTDLDGNEVAGPNTAGQTKAEYDLKMYKRSVQQQDALCQLLEKEGVHVIRPPLLSMDVAKEDPVGLSQSWAREVFSVIGNRVIVNQPRTPHRNKDKQALEQLFGSIEHSGLATVHLLPTCSLDRDENWASDPRPFLEGGDIFRLGKDVIVTMSYLASSPAGFRWLADLLAPDEVEVWPAYLTEDWEHGDYVFMPVHEGLCVAYLDGFVDGLLPAPCTDWDCVVLTRDETNSKFAANGFALRENVMVMPKGSPRVVRALEKKGVDVIELPFDGPIFWQGGIDCSTSELWREE